MVVVVHEAVGMTEPVIAFIDMLEGVQEVDSVLVVLEHGFLLVPAGGDVVDSAGIFYAKGAGHNVATISQNEAIVKLQDVTLWAY